MSFNFFGFDDNEDDNRDLPERDFFDLSDTVGMDGKNNPQDVIKTEIILGNLGDLDLDRTDGPTSIWGQTQDQALRKFQERKFLKADGYIKPRGPTLHKMWTETDGLLNGFNAPTPEEVIKHHETMNAGQPILSLKHPAIKLKPIQDLPALEDGAAFHTQRSADYLANIYDLGDWPRWTAKEIQDGGASAIATTRDVLNRLRLANPGQAAKVARAVVEHLPDELKTAFVGGPIPPALPRWVRSKEIMNRIVRLQAERDHGFDTGDNEPKSMAEMEMRPPARETMDLRSDDPVAPPMTLECTPEKCPPEEGRPLGLARYDDPEDEERRLRNERLDRRRAERNTAMEASDKGGEGPVTEPPTTEPAEADENGVTYGRRPDGSPYASTPVPMPPIKESGDVGEVPEPKGPFMRKPGETFSPIDKPEVRNDKEGDGSFWADREGGRKHKGIDLLTKPGDRIRSPVDGKIVSIGSAYKNEQAFGGQYRAITVKGDNGETYVLRYVSPTTEDGHPLAKVGGRIAAGQVLGIAQDRAKSGDGAMKNHIHVERYGRSGELLDPTPEFQKWRSR